MINNTEAQFLRSYIFLLFFETLKPHKVHPQLLLYIVTSWYLFYILVPLALIKNPSLNIATLSRNVYYLQDVDLMLLQSQA